MPGAKKQRDATTFTIDVGISPEEAHAMVELAMYYHRSMGFTRHLVGMTAGAVMRSKYRFIAQESTVLKEFAQATAAQLAVSRTHSRNFLRSVGRTATVRTVDPADAVLAARLVAGDEDALSEVFDRYAPVVLSAARRVVGS